MDDSGLINGAYLRKLRKEKNLTLEEAAAHLGLSRPHLSNIENEKKGISVELLVTLTRYYDTSSDWILKL